MASVVSESQRMVGTELEERYGIDLGSDRISAIGRGSQQLNSIWGLHSCYLSLNSILTRLQTRLALSQSQALNGSLVLSKLSKALVIHHLPAVPAMQLATK